MFIKYIFASLAMATAVLTLPLDGPTSPTDFSYVGPLVSDDAHYSEDQIAQVHAASNAASIFSQWVVDNQKNPVFDRVFKKYFDPGDRDLVISVFAAITNPNPDARYNPTSTNLDLRNIKVVQDSPSGDNHETACDAGNNYAQLRGYTVQYPELIICPRLWKHAAAFPFAGAPTWPDVKAPTCASVGDRVTRKMFTMGTVFVNKFAHYQWIMGTPLKDYGGFTQELARGPIAVLALKREQSRVNADSYAWFATELVWSMNCGKDFQAPIAGDDLDPN